ncbi:pyridoxal phosphate-dependent aminotransferase [Mycobacterium lehmannii]|uniref:pyridoxal phosphate-dependent aminotransferase n=1 Tax=Mycobacterium lehmannii TaxID=2048550 RepID=UPI000B93DA69|nr:pyridoxal phosphate-dependent aminotransferase [Mycobacterium lehmannii]
MTGKISLRAGIPPFYVMDVWLAAAERQRSHGDLVNLSAGQPSAGAPAAVRAAAKEALETTVLGYTVALGIPELRAAIAHSYLEQHGLQVDPDDVVITTGSSGGFLLAFLACFDVGDRVAIASPGYPCYRNILSALGCDVVEIPCGAETRFQPTVQMLEELDPPVQGVIVASPANPTGTVIPPDELAAIASWCASRGVRLISDEVYHGLVYEGAPAVSCAWATSRDSIVVNSFSKYFAMTGWRLGWLLVPKELQRAVDRLTGNFTICPPTLPQYAAIAAFTPESIAEADALLHHYAANRQMLLEGLRGLGIDRLAPTDGAFYVYADVSHLTSDSLSFCSKLLADTGVAIAPGIDFDPARGHTFVRLSFAGPASDITEALRRIGSWLGQLQHH